MVEMASSFGQNRFDSSHYQSDQEQQQHQHQRQQQQQPYRSQQSRLDTNAAYSADYPRSNTAGPHSHNNNNNNNNNNYYYTEDYDSRDYGVEQQQQQQQQNFDHQYPDHHQDNSSYSSQTQSGRPPRRLQEGQQPYGNGDHHAYDSRQQHQQQVLASQRLSSDIHPLSHAGEATQSGGSNSNRNYQGPGSPRGEQTRQDLPSVSLSTREHQQQQQDIQQSLAPTSPTFRQSTEHSGTPDETGLSHLNRHPTGPTPPSSAGRQSAITNDAAKDSKGLHSKADPTFAMQEAEPGA